MKTRNVCAMSKAQSGPSQVNELTESVISHIPFSNSKEVTIFQIRDKPLQDNVEEEMEDSVPPSILGETSPMEKQLVTPSVETKHLERDKTDTLPTITDRQERMEWEQDKEILYRKPWQFAPKRGRGGYTNRDSHTRSRSSDNLEDWIPHEGPSPDKLRKEVFTIMNKSFNALRAQVEALIMGDWTCWPEGRWTWSRDNRDKHTSLQQHEERNRRHKLPPGHDTQDHGTHVERNTSIGRMPGQQESYKLSNGSSETK